MYTHYRTSPCFWMNGFKPLKLWTILPYTWEWAKWCCKGEGVWGRGGVGMLDSTCTGHMIGTSYSKLMITFNSISLAKLGNSAKLVNKYLRWISYHWQTHSFIHHGFPKTTVRFTMKLGKTYRASFQLLATLSKKI